MGCSCGKQLLWSDFQLVLLDISCQVVSKISCVCFGGDLRDFFPGLYGVTSELCI